MLHELLTGKPAFAGEDITEILASVVKPELPVIPSMLTNRNSGRPASSQTSGTAI